MVHYRFGKEQIHHGGGPGRVLLGLILAALLGVGAFFGGRYAAYSLCEDSCDPLIPYAEAFAQPFPVFGQFICWAMVILAVAGLFLWIALSHYPRHLGLSFMSLLVSFMMGMIFANGWCDPLPPAAEEKLVVAEEILPPPAVLEPEIEPIAQADPVCPEGNFWNGEGCSTCTVMASVPQSSNIYFSPLLFEAAWKYADDQRYVRTDTENGEFPVTDLVIDGSVSMGGQAVCASSAILVIGSASSDGPRQRNLDRAIRRAERLAQRVAAACPNQPEVFAISMGQSKASRDLPVDRALTVIGLDTPDGTPVTASLVAQELGHVLYSDTHGAPLLSRHEQFEQASWTWVKGAVGDVTVNLSPRPYESVERLRDDAPTACFD